MNSRPRAYIFGAGGTGLRLLPKIKERYDVAGFIDNDTKYSHGGGLPALMSIHQR